MAPRDRRVAGGRAVYAFPAGAGEDGAGFDAGDVGVEVGGRGAGVYGCAYTAGR